MMRYKVRLAPCRVTHLTTGLAHRNLHDVAGILHRDIKPGNILINTEGEEGERGILIYFDHAIRTNNVTIFKKKKDCP